MQKIRAKDTKPELSVRRFLHSRGFRYRLHRRDLPGVPDLVFPIHRTVVFVHGCFWHQHPGCVHSGIPLSNRHYWEPKLKRTIARDKNHQEALVAEGWRVIVVWECEIDDKKLEELERELWQPC